MMTPSHKLALAAGLALAIALTLSCSGDGGGEPPPSSSSAEISSSSDGVAANPSSSSVSSSSSYACEGWAESVTTAPTCEAKGVKTLTCTSGPSDTKTEDIPQLSWSESVTTPATCIAAGVKTLTCPGNASPAKTEAIAKLEPSSTQLCDARDGKLYKFVPIGTGATAQKWMAENLSYDATGSKCYAEGVSGVSADSVSKNCAKYGRLYNWATAMGNSASSTAVPSGVQGVCPSGWHLPSDAEWNALMKSVNPACSDNSNCAGAGTKLKAASGWNPSAGVPAGTDEFGFSALPGGLGASDGYFLGVGYDGYWWSASELTSNLANYRNMYYDYEYVGYTYDDKDPLFSVRCLQDSP